MRAFATTAWHVDPLATLTMAAALAGYTVAARPHDARRALGFAGAIVLLALTLLSPLDALASEYLLSARMTQHLLLSQVIPPLLLLSLSAAVVRPALRRPVFAAVERTVRRPVVAWTAGIGTLWLWHWRPLFDLSTSSHVIGQLHHLTVLLAGLVFWWPVVSPLTEARVGALAGVGHLASACLASTVMGMALTFSSGVVYDAYLQPADAYGILADLRSAGLTARVDQQIGGLIMWVPCCVLYVCAIGAVLLRWYTEPEPAAATGSPAIAAG
jgi:cytochrome c oxidase assembly factor CtaG